MRYEIQIEVVNEGYINFEGTPLSKEQFEELDWVDAVDFLNTYAEVSYCDTRDWSIIQPKKESK